MGSLKPCKGCYLVGSSTYDSTEEALRQFATGIPGRLKRIPDGEVGERNYFTWWQYALLEKWAPGAMAVFQNNSSINAREFTPEQIQESLTKMRETGIETKWDDFAIESYAKFKQLKEEGVIPAEVKFQVCLPTIASVVGIYIERKFQRDVEPIYEAALFKAMRRIQDNIPHDQLAIQIDLAVDSGMWEGVIFQYWGEGDAKQGQLDYIAKQMAQVDNDVDLGIHNCYGDMEHRHYHEPPSLAAVTERGLGILGQINRPVKFFHVPVPLSATDKLESYFEPLKQILPKFREDGTELYLGLVHENDLDGTWKRIETARKVLGEDTEFGVATECGWGRVPKENIQSLYDIYTQVTEPVI